jgi:hypothetical protein
MTRQSFENLQSFSDILKSEAMKRRQKKGRWLGLDLFPAFGIYLIDV